MVDVHDARPPVLINTDMVEADVIVITVVMMPTPTTRSPPRMAPGAQPCAGPKPEAETYSPIIREAYAKTVGAWPTHPVSPDVRRIVITGAIDHDRIRADFRAQITGRITYVHYVRSRSINPRINHV